MPKKVLPTECPDDAQLAEERRIGREALYQWQRIAADDPNDTAWARRIGEALDAEELRCLIAEYRRFARDPLLDPNDRAIARQRAKALVASELKRTGKHK